MSASHSPDISDIHPPTTVAETLSVTTDPSPISVGQSLGVAVSETQSTLPNVGTNITVPDTGQGPSISERSSAALLNLASSTLNLTDILNAQQQALEQFQCQLQFAQQIENVNQRLDAIERTLNNLITQKVQEDASVQKQPDAPIVAVTPLRPSQQIPPNTPESGLSSGDTKRKKLPRELCAKVRSTYHSLNLEFKTNER